MISCGQTLLTARLDKKLTLTQVSRQTKIPQEVLRALEKNHFAKLPAETYIKGFLKNYANFLGLNPQKTVALFRRDYQKQQKKSVLPSGLTHPLDKPRFLTNFRTFLVLGVGLVFFLGYLGLSLFNLYQPPGLTVATPKESDEVVSPVLVKGQTDHDAKLTLNGKFVNLEPDGSFTTVYQGPAGAVSLIFEATSRRQKTTVVSRHIIIAN